MNEEDEDDFMIIGAKKTNSSASDDKHKESLCVENFKFIFGTSKLDTGKLSELCFEGLIEEKYIRPTLWRVFLDIFNEKEGMGNWIETTNKLRNEYKAKVRGLANLKKLSGDPLGNSNDSNWNSFFEESEMKKIINLDLSRTYQDRDIFKSTKIKDLLGNVLFIWSRENKETLYKQGMNEILAVLLFAFYPFYFKSNVDFNQALQAYEKQDYKTIYQYFHNENDLEADLYIIFSTIMSRGIKDLYISGIPYKDKAEFIKKDLFTQQWNETTQEESDHEVRLLYFNLEINTSPKKV
jgi:hypothetical protein